MSKMTRVAVLGLVVMSSFCALGARAGTASYPGTLCVQIDAPTFRMTTSYGGGRVTTFETRAVDVECPVTQTGGNVTAASVSADKWPAAPSAVLSCRVTVADRFGQNVHSSPAVTATTTSSIMTLAAVPFSYPAGIKFIRCTIPAANFDNTGAILSYSVTEA